MQVIDSAEERITPVPAVVTLGNFDGFHLGHQALVAAVVRDAQQLGCQAALVTFDPHPQEVVHTNKKVPRICTPELRLRGFSQSGLDAVHVIPFTRELAELEAEEFARRFLLERFQLEKVVIGYDFRFGKNRGGDFKLLETLSQSHSFALEEVPPVQVEQQTVNSTLIRQLLQNYQFGELPTYLGRPHSLLGTVVAGEQRGRQLGIPTANLLPQVPLALPNGVYASRLQIGGRVHYGVTNVGQKPTFGTHATTVETWIFDFEEDIYGETLEVWPIHHLREEQKFSSLDALIRQIHQDAEQAQELLAHSEVLSHLFPAP